MTFDVEQATDELLKQGPPDVAFDAGEATEELLTGHEAAASKLLEANFELGSYAGSILRWSLARGDTLEEKRARLRQKYPEGELDVLPESIVMGFDEDTLVFRESPQAQWKLVEPQGFDIFDIPEAIAPSAESIIGETVMAVGSGGMSVPMTVGRQIVGAIIGEALEQGGQFLEGSQRQSLAEIGMEVGQEGLWSGVGGFAMSPLVAAKNVATGAGALKVGDEGLETIAAAKEIDPDLVKGFTPALVTDNPAIRLSEAQSAALLPGLPRRYRELIDIFDSAVRGSAPGNAATAMQNIAVAMDDLGKYFLRRISTKGTPMSKGGAALREGVEQYSQASREIVSKLYDAARQIEEPAFDMKPVMSLAEDLKLGSKGILDKGVERQIGNLEAIDGPITLSDGSILSVTDQIRNVRTELYSLKHVEPGQVANQKTGQANDLYQAINKVLDNPTNTNQVFRDAWKIANEQAAKRFAKLDAAPIVAAAKSQNPADLVRTYVRPYNSDNLLAIRDTISTRKWNQFVDAAYSDLATNPANITKTLDSFDQETLDVLMPRKHQALWRRVGKEIDRITDVGVDKIAEIQVSNRNFIDNLITSATPRRVHTLIRAANNTNNKGMRDSLRSAIVEWAWDGIIRKAKNKLIVNEGVLANRIKSLKNSGMWSVLSVKERRILQNAKIVSRAFQGVMDAGTSIQAAEAVSGAKKLQKTAIMTFLRNEVLAQFYLSPMGQRILIGSGLPNSNGAILRLMGGSLAQMSRPQDISELEDE